MIAILGGTGLIGSAVARRLAQDGFPVRIVSRDPAAARAGLPEGAEVVRADVRDMKSLVPALAGCRGLHISLAGGPAPEDYEAVEHQGTANAVKAAEEAGVSRITYLSGATVSEKHAWFYGTRAKLGGERAVRSGRLPWTVFRASWFMESLPRFVRGKRAALIGNPPHPVRWLAADDFGRMVSMAHRGAGAGKLLDAHGPQAIPMLKALEAFCAAVHPGLKAGTAPAGLLAFIARISGDRKLADTVRFMKYCAKAQETEEGESAAAALGVTPITLAAWCAGMRNRNVTPTSEKDVTISR